MRGTELVNDEGAWKLGRLNHVAIAVPDLQKAMAMYRDVLGAKVSEPVVSIWHVPRGVRFEREMAGVSIKSQAYM